MKTRDVVLEEEEKREKKHNGKRDGEDGTIGIEE